MSIWKKEFTIERLNRSGHDTLNQHLGIEITEVGDDYMIATMPVDNRTVQPYRLLHGGASVALAETVGSIAGTTAAEEGYYCVGLEINANHLSKATEGIIVATAKPVHIGRTTQVWEIRMQRDDGKMTCISRLTLAVLKG